MFKKFLLLVIAIAVLSCGPSPKDLGYDTDAKIAQGQINDIDWDIAMIEKELMWLNLAQDDISIVIRLINSAYGTEGHDLTAEQRDLLKTFCPKDFENIASSKDFKWKRGKHHKAWHNLVFYSGDCIAGLEEQLEKLKKRKEIAEKELELLEK